jgi:hypothetical protein
MAGRETENDMKDLIEQIGENRKRHDRASPKGERTGRAMKV